MPRLASLIVLLLMGATADDVPAVQPRRPGQESFLMRAVFTDGRLWLLSDAGQLSSITEGKNVRIEESLPEPVLDLCLQGGHPVVITCKRDNCTNWTLRRWVSGKWSVEATIKRRRDALVALGCAAEELILLTTRRLIDPDQVKKSDVVLSEKLDMGMVASVHVTSDQVFVGINAGEWGGGLRRIDRYSGKVELIELNVTGTLCGGPLNTACDPVNGIAAEPWNPDCIAVAVGLVHFAPRGRIVEVCGNQVRRLYFKPYGKQPPGPLGEEDDEPFRTVAFFGLTRAGDALWAVGLDGIYRIEAGGATRSIPLPAFEAIGDIRVSFAIPQFVLVLTNINQRRSISGSVPTLVAR
jgi:hypothetical protein